MKPVLVLVDLQEDFLAEQGLEPHRESITAGAAALLAGARASFVPVIHVQTKVEQEPDGRMRHWKEAGRWSCLAGTAGQAAPEALAPAPGETILDKTGFSAGGEALREAIANTGCDVAVVAGVHTHACVRQAVLDIYEGGVEVCVARDAIGSHEPAHAAQTEAYLRQRLIPFLSSDEILGRFRTGKSAPAARGAPSETSSRVQEALRAVRMPSFPLAARGEILEAAAALVEAQSERIAREIVAEVGKPIRHARGEAVRTALLLRTVARRASAETLDREEPEALVRRRPLGTVAVITPWNNPVAIAAGQLAPAYAYGNAIVWKPAPAGEACAATLHELFLQAGIEPEALRLLNGDGDAGVELVRQPQVDGVCFTGATSTGRVVAALCADRNVPLQAELGGNNAAIVTAGADLQRAARLVADAAFGCAGQRCTATRRVVVAAEVHDGFVALLERYARALAWGDPWHEETQVGPLLSEGHAARIASLVGRAEAAGHRVLQPHLSVPGEPAKPPRFYPPTIVLCDDPTAEIVQEESFGPVLVVQRANGWEEALALMNGVRHGLAAALFSDRPEEQRDFLDVARAGILKLNQATVEAGVDVPFLGWKSSGMGPPQHGAANREFFTRAQAVYRDTGSPR